VFLFYSVFYLYSAAACQLLLNEYVMLCYPFGSYKSRVLARARYIGPGFGIGVNESWSLTGF